jgi:hypothetical protein
MSMATYFCTRLTSSAASKYYFFLERNIILRGIFQVGQIITDTHSTVNLNAYACTHTLSLIHQTVQTRLSKTGGLSRVVAPLAGLPINTIYPQRCTAGT